MKDSKDLKLHEIQMKIWQGKSKSLTDDEREYLKNSYLTINQLFEICKSYIEEGKGSWYVWAEEYYLLNSHDYSNDNNDIDSIDFNAIHVDDDIELELFK